MRGAGGDARRGGPSTAPELVEFSLLRRARDSGRDPAPFTRGPRVKIWLTAGVLALMALTVVPFVRPGLSPMTERLATLLALLFLLASVGLWFGMRGRAFLVAFVLVALLYGLTAWTSLAFNVEDFFTIALLVSFGVFALAGFNLVFVLEEMVYDAHRTLHLRHPAWALMPTLVVGALALLIPVWRSAGGPRLSALWVASIANLVVLGSWWFIRLVNRLDERTVLREIHLFVVGITAAAGLADGVRYLHKATGLVPSVVAYVVLLGTWVYVTYTTLQRAHFLMSGKDTLPWLAVLLAASFAILAHAQVLFEVEGVRAVDELVDLRVSYLIAGIWIGIAFYAARSLWRAARLARQRLILRGRAGEMADKAARVAESLLWTERAVEEAAFQVFRRMDEVLPGQSHAPRHVGWQIDEERLRRLDDEKENHKKG